MPATEFGWLPTQKKKKTAIEMAKKNHPKKIFRNPGVACPRYSN
jgi:hypothetical protein